MVNKISPKRYENQYVYVQKSVSALFFMILFTLSYVLKEQLFTACSFYNAVHICVIIFLCIQTSFVWPIPTATALQPSLALAFSSSEVNSVVVATHFFCVFFFHLAFRKAVVFLFSFSFCFMVCLILNETPVDVGARN